MKGDRDVACKLICLKTSSKVMRSIQGGRDYKQEISNEVNKVTNKKLPRAGENQQKKLKRVRKSYVDKGVCKE